MKQESQFKMDELWFDEKQELENWYPIPMEVPIPEVEEMDWHCHESLEEEEEEEKKKEEEEDRISFVIQRPKDVTILFCNPTFLIPDWKADWTKNHQITPYLFQFYLYRLIEQLNQKYDGNHLHLITVGNGLHVLAAIELFLHHQATYQTRHRYLPRTLRFRGTIYLTCYLHRYDLRGNSSSDTWLKVESLLPMQLLRAQALGASVMDVEEWKDLNKELRFYDASYVVCCPFMGVDIDDIDTENYIPDTVQGIYIDDEIEIAYHRQIGKAQGRCLLPISHTLTRTHQKRSTFPSSRRR